MGFLQPNSPKVDYAMWRAGSRPERMRPLLHHLAEAGFGTPDVVIVGYLMKILLYVAGGMLFALSTSGIDGWSSVGQWWHEPVVFEKVVLFSMLFEVLGLGCGFGPLNLRFLPPLGSFLYWLRPGTIRLPPWPDRVPLTRGDRRGVLDIALYAALLVLLVRALLSDAVPGTEIAGSSLGVLARSVVAAPLVVLVILGLRDKTIFLAARSEVYGTLAACTLLQGVDMIVAAKLVMLAIWWGAATSKLNRHFPYVVAMMMSNSPVWRLPAIRRRFHRRFSDDLRPSRLSAALAHGGTAVEFGVPLVLILSHGGLVTTVAAIVMIAFHLNIIVSFPMGVPLEWNVYMIFGIGTLFVDKASYGVGDLVHPIPVILGMLVVVGTVILGNLRPDKVSFLPAMRYYAGNWDTSLWCFTESAVEKFEAGIIKAAALPHLQLEKIHGKEDAEITLVTGWAFRAMHTHGRALFGLVPRAVAGRPESDYVLLDGETVGGATLGWNFGDGHLHDEQLIRAVQDRCHLAPGELRVIILEAQPMHRQTQRYRIVDAASGCRERGRVRVADLAERQPWDTDIPIQVESPADLVPSPRPAPEQRTALHHP
ncbi:DUF3556 domain-containing protein [Nocardioides sp. Kera G14]|uniref:DUF3556 domain-containing protein n=1 Tax=Nocardioides sp. Kera G14 TaxID=2884264 RepID=UPI001D10DA30|nr:DUF3556 domain-containing protein [Nocardioides sp. Kera G14]UDY25180.1 DUF3556 domain-containing protein [Nocardioides sp. Kera G14]